MTWIKIVNPQGHYHMKNYCSRNESKENKSCVHIRHVKLHPFSNHAIDHILSPITSILQSYFLPSMQSITFSVSLCAFDYISSSWSMTSWHHAWLHSFPNFLHTITHIFVFRDSFCAIGHISSPSLVQFFLCDSNPSTIYLVIHHQSHCLSFPTQCGPLPNIILNPFHAISDQVIPDQFILDQLMCTCKILMTTMRHVECSLSQNDNFTYQNNIKGFLTRARCLP